MIPPPWPLVRPLVDAAESSTRHRDPKFIAENDQVQAFTIARLGDFSIDVRLHHDLYGVLAILGFLFECATNGARNDVFDPHAERAIKALLLTVTDALAPLAPEEARS